MAAAAAGTETCQPAFLRFPFFFLPGFAFTGFCFFALMGSRRTARGVCATRKEKPRRRHFPCPPYHRQFLGRRYKKSTKMQRDDDSFRLLLEYFSRFFFGESIVRKSGPDVKFFLCK